MLDVVLVVDTSGSILTEQPPGVNNVALIKAYLRTIVSYLQIDEYYDHVGLVSFESSAQIVLTLQQGRSLKVVNSSFDLLPPPGGETNIPMALNLALQVLTKTLLWHTKFISHNDAMHGKSGKIGNCLHRT